jgi:hypothetical protein
MRFLLWGCLLALGSSPALATGVISSDIHKTLDAKAAYCAAEANLGAAGYAVTGAEIGAQGGELSVEVHTHSVVCAKDGDRFVWADRNPLLPIESKDLHGNPIRIWQKDLSSALVSYAYKLLGSIPADEFSRRTAAFHFPVSAVVDPARRKEMREGKDVLVTTEFFQRSIQTVETQDGKLIPLGLRSGGSFTVRFWLGETSSGLKVRGVEIR